MEFGDFKIRIESMNDNLIQIINERNNNFFKYQNEIYSNLNNKKIEYLDTLSSLEKRFYSNSEEKTQTILSIKSIITQLKENLDTELKEYLNTHNSTYEKDKLLNQKDNVLGSFKNQKKKETQDINQKIANLDRECLNILKARSQAFEQEEKEYKARIFELEKKMKYEVNKVNEAILTPVLGDNPEEIEKKSQNYKVSDEIKEFRIKGINEIASIKNKYLEDLKKEEINFNVYKCNYEKDSSIIREEYKQKIEILKYEKSIVQDELQTKLDLYDFDVYKKTIEIDKEFRLEENNIKKRFNDKKFNYLNEVHLNLNEQSNQKLNDINNLYDQVKVYDNDQLENVRNYLIEANNVFHDKNSNLYQTLNNVVRIYLDLITNIINEYWDNYYQHENKIIEVLLITSYSSNALNNFNFDKYNVLINELFLEFNKNQKTRQDIFFSILNDMFKKLLSQVEEIYIEITNYKNQEKNCFDELINKTKNIVEKANFDGKLHYRNINNNENVVINDTIKNDTLVKQQDIKKIEDSDNFIKNDIDNKSKELEEKLNNYLKKQKLSKLNKERLYKDTLINIKHNIEEIKKKNIKDIKAKNIEIKKKYENEIRVIEDERKTKIKIGQI